jgi:hypothetical protein
LAVSIPFGATVYLYHNKTTEKKKLWTNFPSWQVNYVCNIIPTLKNQIPINPYESRKNIFTQILKKKSNKMYYLILLLLFYLIKFIKSAFNAD